MFALQKKHLWPNLLRAVSNLKLFVELLWDFLSSACFHSRISTLPGCFLLVFGNKRRIFAKIPPFWGARSCAGARVDFARQVGLSGTNPINEQELANRSYKRRAV